MLRAIIFPHSDGYASRFESQAMADKQKTQANADKRSISAAPENGSAIYAMKYCIDNDAKKWLIYSKTMKNLKGVRGMFAGAAVAAATLGTLGASHARADIIPEITVNMTSVNTTPVTADGLTYPAHTPSVLYIQNFNTANDTEASGCETITALTGPFTTSPSLVWAGYSNGYDTQFDVSGGTSPYGFGIELAIPTSGITASLPSFPGVGTAVGDEDLFAYINASGPFYMNSTQFGYTSGSSPDFAIDSMTVGVPEPSSLALGAAAVFAGLTWRPRRQEDFAMAGR
jgi:hypothetical protein